MTKIFARNQFSDIKNDGDASPDISPEVYLQTMLSCVKDGELRIAKKRTDVSVELADDLDSASYVDRYQMDAMNVNAEAVLSKEQAIFAVCKAIALKDEEKDAVLTEVRTAVLAMIEPNGLRAENVVNRAHRLEKLLQLGAPALIVNQERCYLVEELMLNTYAKKSKTTLKSRPLFGKTEWRFDAF